MQVKETSPLVKKEYTAEYGVYQNCHIIGREMKTFLAHDDKEAEKTAIELSKVMEQECSTMRPEDDWWICLEDLYED